MDEVGTLLKILKTPSPSGDETAAAQTFAETATMLGFHAEIDRIGNVLASIGRGRPVTMTLGHIDTVPGLWPVLVEDEWVHGRGAVDAKGPLMAALWASARLGVEVPGTRIVVAALGEEADSRGALEILKGPRPDALIVAEPSGWSRVTIGYRGHRIGMFRATTTSCHASAPHPGSLDQAVATAARLQNYVRSLSTRSAFYSSSCRFLQWNHSATADEEVTEFDVDIRAPPGFDWAALERHVALIDWSPPVDAVVLDKGNAAVRALVRGIRAAGGRPEYVLKGGTSDMNHAARVWRIPMASYGPGNPNLAHSSAERLSISEFRRSIGVLEAAIRILASTG